VVLREGWARSEDVRTGGRTALRRPGLSRVITQILASPRIFLVRKAHCSTQH